MNKREEMFKELMERYYNDEYGYLKFLELKESIVMVRGTLNDNRSFTTEKMTIVSGKSYEELFNNNFDTIVIEQVNPYKDYEEYEDEWGLLTEEEFNFLKEVYTHD